MTSVCIVNRESEDDEEVREFRYVAAIIFERALNSEARKSL